MQRVHHDQQFHEILIGRRGGLHHEYVAAAHVFLYLDLYLAVAETSYLRLAQGDAEMIGDGARKFGIGVSRKHHYPAFFSHNA
jgi:hypothetical protein